MSQSQLENHAIKSWQTQNDSLSILESGKCILSPLRISDPGQAWRSGQRLPVSPDRAAPECLMSEFGKTSK